MFDENAVELLAEEITADYQELNTEMYKRVGDSVKEVEKGNNDHIEEDMAWYESELAKITAASLVAMYLLYDRTAKDNLNASKVYYEAQNIDFVEFSKNTAVKEALNEVKNETKDLLSSIQKSNAIGFTKTVDGLVVYTPFKEQYQELIDTAIQNTLNGGTLQKEVNNIVKIMGNGVKIEYASGYHRRLDSSVNQAVRDGVKKTFQNSQSVIGKEIGADGVEISAHAFCATDHQPYQGKQYTHEQFDRIQGLLNRPIGKFNCGHLAYEVVLGVSSPAHSDEELKDYIKGSNEEFEFDGITYSKYEGTQLQRKIETAIRSQKDLQILANASGNKELVSEAQSKITSLTNKYSELSKVSGLPTKTQRLSVAGYRKVATK